MSVGSWMTNLRSGDTFGIRDTSTDTLAMLGALYELRQVGSGYGYDFRTERCSIPLTNYKVVRRLPLGDC